MERNLLTAAEAARALGISRATMYGWLAQSNAGTLLIRGQPYTIEYLQGGAKGQGRIQLETVEIERIKDAMRVQPCRRWQRRSPTKRHHYPGIHVELGDPGN